MVFVLRQTRKPKKPISVDHVKTDLSISCHESDASESLDCVLSVRKKTTTNRIRNGDTFSWGDVKKKRREQKGERGRGREITFEIRVPLSSHHFCLAIFHTTPQLTKRLDKLTWRGINMSIETDDNKQTNKKARWKAKHSLSISSVGVSLLGLSVVLLVGLVPRRHSRT